MVFVFKDDIIKLGENYIADFSLIYGIGFERISYLSSLLGISQVLSTKHINIYFFESLSMLIKLFFFTDERLQLLIKQVLISLMELKIRRGVRFFRKLPVRGQGTKRNGKQRKYLKQDEI